MKKQLTKIELIEGGVWATTADGELVELFWECDDNEGLQPLDEVYQAQDAELAGIEVAEVCDLMVPA